MSFRLVRTPKQDFFHVHAHSRYSYRDALPKVKDMVATVAGLGQPALALTDHGNMGGSVQLYRECRSAGIKPFPGVEAYFVNTRADKAAKRYHLGLLATSGPGYEALVRLNTRSNLRENFHNKALIDWTDLAEWKDRGWTDGLALTTGCFFGLVIQTLMTRGQADAREVAGKYAAMVPNTFVEVQNHRIDHNELWNDTAISDALAEIADDLGLPLVATQDSHYCDPADKSVHETLKRAVAFGPDQDDAVFPGDGFHLCDQQWVQDRHEPAVWDRSLQGYQRLLEIGNVVIPELENYHYNIPLTVPDPDSYLEQMCQEEMARRKLPKVYQERLSEELSVVKDTGMAGYLVFVKEVTDWCRDNAAYIQTRGSAAGSLICWLIGISQHDPIKWELRFERFISRDRTKPPDVDIDIEDTRRNDLIEWLKTRFNVCQIGTYNTYSIHEKGGRGSLIVAFKKVARGKMSEEALDAIKAIDDIPEPDRSALLELSSRKVLKGYGVHAAGLVVTSNRNDFDRLVPTMLVASSDTTVTQYIDKDVELLGLVKLDVLGLRTLSLLRRAQELIGRKVEDGLDWIPLDDARTLTMIRNGETDGIFQLEGGTARRGCREVKVRSVKDIIAIQAIYRPAVMNSGGKDTYVSRRFGIEKMPEMHPVLMKYLKQTHGIPIFQEQVIGVLRDIGMTPEDLTTLLKAVKMSNDNVIEAQQTIASYQHMVETMCKEQEFSPADMDFIWRSIEGFAEYGFNRAHATVYGITAYRAAYLKTHHQLEFATALLETSEGKEVEEIYVSAVRRMGIRIMRPHVNISGQSYSIDRQRKAVRKGLVSIKGVGERTACELAMNAPYSSVEDIIGRCSALRVNGGKKWAKHRILIGHLAMLCDAGALEDLADVNERVIPEEINEGLRQQ